MSDVAFLSVSQFVRWVWPDAMRVTQCPETVSYTHLLRGTSIHIFVYPIFLVMWYDELDTFGNGLRHTRSAEGKKHVVDDNDMT